MKDGLMEWNIARNIYIYIWSDVIWENESKDIEAH